MEPPNCVLANIPLTAFTLVANAFYTFCMVRPLHGERIKQPLQLLLGSLIFCAFTYLLLTFGTALFGTVADSTIFLLVSYMVLACSVSTCVSSTVCLNVFYYTQIVPVQRAPFIWIKNNIKLIIYCIWLFEKICSFFDATVLTVEWLTLTGHLPGGFSYNVTMNHDMILIPLFEWLRNTYIIVFWIMQTRFILSVLVMLMCSGSTVVYLCRHMRRMVRNGQSPTCQRFCSQVRVTVTGILQGVLYMLYAMWMMYSTLPLPVISDCAYFTVFNFYMTGTAFNLGAGQRVFRQRAVNVWLRVVKWCKAPEVQQSQQTG